MRAKIRLTIQAKLVGSILISVLVVITLSILCMFYIKDKGTELAGVKAARSLVYNVQNLRRFYSNIIMPRAHKLGIQSHLDFYNHEDTLPEAAALVNIIGKELQNEYPGSNLRLYSRYPFLNRIQTEQYDSFEKDALDALESNSNIPFYRLENLNGRLSIRYAVSDIMQESCVGCHNSHPQSQKKDWQVGDIRGALEVIIPVDEVASTLKAGTMTLTGVISISLLGMTVMILLLCRYILVRPIKELCITSDRIKAGDLQARASVQSKDEVGILAEEFNSLIDKLTSLVETIESERDNMQNSVAKLLNEVSDVAQGDLTVEAEVSEDMTGAIAVSFNHMIYELRRIITNVQEATKQVSLSAREICNNTDNLAEGSGSQAERIYASALALDEMSISIRQVSENSSLSVTVAEQALSNAKRGSSAVYNTILAIHRISHQIQETSSYMHDLGERSQNIGEIVQLIADIADRTSVLALNASIEAALAGEAGQGFATVAREVEHLAERAAGSTKQIQDLVDTIQCQTKDAMRAMENSIREVSQGAQVADQAGNALREIESVASHLADLIQSISLETIQQVRGSENLSKAMSEISEVTQYTADGTRKAAKSVSKLAILADELRNSVSTFQLP